MDDDTRDVDVLQLIDRLDEVVHDARVVPLTDQVRLDREAVFELLDEVRAVIPEEVKQARWIVKERQEMLAEARRESERLLAEARQQAAEERSSTKVTMLAERQAAEVLATSRRRADDSRAGVDAWADEILAMLELNLEKFKTAVRRGRERLMERTSQAHPVEQERESREIAE